MKAMEDKAKEKVLWPSENDLIELMLGNQFTYSF